MRKRPISRGTAYYRAHRQAEVERKRDYRARLDSGYTAYQQVHPKATRREFHRALKDNRASVPSHTPKKAPTGEQRQRHRRFVEGMLGRSYSVSDFESTYGGR
jgi:hypothetical protein